MDLQNILLQSDENNPKYTFRRNADNTDFETSDGQPLRRDGSNGIPYILETSSGNLLPSIGFSFEF